MTKLSVDHKMPLEQISRLFADLYGYELNSETVETTLEQGYELAAPLEGTVREQLQQAKTVHFDETGLRIGGNWDGCTSPVTSSTRICSCMRNAARRPCAVMLRC